MKKLYVNVERCEVHGGAQALTPIVTNMDRRLQEIANETQQIKGILLKYVGVNSSDQFKKAADATKELSEQLYNASEQLNEMQGQIVRYQNKIARFNERNEGFGAPNRHNVQKVEISVDTAHFQFTYQDMVYVEQCIQKYVNDARTSIQVLRRDKETIGSIWRDPQYRDFSAFIDDVCAKLMRGAQTLEEYARHLSTKIRELRD